MEQRENIIKSCFNSWISKDREAFKNSLSPEITYIESWGPAYGNIDECMAWFDEWNKANSVIKWEIEKFWHEGDASLCQWYFQCECNGVREGFDGVSVIKFDGEGKIIYLKEYQSKLPNHYPYKK